MILEFKHEIASHWLNDWNQFLKLKPVRWSLTLTLNLLCLFFQLKLADPPSQSISTRIFLSLQQCHAT